VSSYGGTPPLFTQLTLTLFSLVPLRANQVVHLDSKLRLIDSPGVIFSKEAGSGGMSVERILRRVPKTTLMLQYGIQDYADIQEFLALVALKFGQVKKGGVPNPEAAEQKIIQDWHT
jgi:nuclear GTP-binding protein